MDVLNELLAGFVRIWPFFLGLEHHIAVRNIRRHRVSRDLGGAGSGKCTLDLRDLLGNCLFQPLLHIHGLGEAGPWNAQSLKRKITLAKARNELATHSHHQQGRQQHASDGATEYQCAVTHDPVEHGRIAIARCAHQAVVLLLHLTSDKKRNSSGHEGDR